MRQAFDPIVGQRGSRRLEAPMFLLENPTRSYAWGSRTAIADLLGHASPDVPEAELWIGAHPASPSGIVEASADLLTHLRADPTGMLGDAARNAFGDRLPYLLKVLAVERPLSLQVHPDQRHAAEGFDAEHSAGSQERVFKDPHHKPELLYALGEFEALCGFRPADEVREVADRLAERSEVFAQIASLLDASDIQDGMLSACEYVARIAIADVSAAIGELCAVAPGPDAAERVATELATVYPADRAVLLVPLMCHRRLAPGDVLAVGAGTPHTYLRGFAVELTTCSDNTIRAGITAKPSDFARFIDVLRVDAAPDQVRIEQRGPAERVFTTGHAEFELSVLTISPEASVHWSPKPRVLLVLDGKVTVTDQDEALTLARGESVFLPPGAGPVEVSGDGLAVQATTGL